MNGLKNMTKSKKELKTEKMLKTKAETKERRSSLDCKTYSVKIDSSHFNRLTQEYFKKVFLEAKWFYNYVLTQDFKTFDTKIKEVKILNKEKVEEIREIKHLSSQMKQSIFQRAIDNCVGLKASKSKGRRIGKLKFKTIVNSIPLVQTNVTFRIVSANHIELQKLKQKLRVRGLKQIKNFEEIACATLIRSCGSYYLNVIGYEKPKSRVLLGDIGIDMGIKTDLTFSNRIKLDCKIPVSNSTKRVQRRIAKSVKGSKNRWKLRNNLQKEYAKSSNQRKDIKNKVVSYLKNNFEIFIQDEMIKQWQSGRFGKAISKSAIGEIKSSLKNNEHTHVVPRSYPSTKLCYKCGTLNTISLSERVYRCDCGYTQDRDIHSAINIILAERKEFKPLENDITSSMLKYFKTIPNIEVNIV